MLGRGSFRVVVPAALVVGLLVPTVGADDSASGRDLSADTGPPITVPAASAATTSQADGRPSAVSRLEPSVIHAGPTGRLALRGPWRVVEDPRNHGHDKGYPAGDFRGKRVSLPYSPNAKTLTGTAGARSHDGSIAWYRTTFTAPQGGLHRLRFESVNHKAIVYLNGRRLGTHTGEYLPFEFLVDLEPGRQNELVVKADWRDPDEMKATGWHRTWFNFGGINREVTIRPVVGSELVAPTIQTRLADDGSADVEITVHVKNRRRDDRPIQVQGRLRRDGRIIDLQFPAVTVRSGKTRVVLARTRIDDPALWAPGEPNLYELELFVPHESGYRQRVGLREVKKDGTRLLINGKHVTFRGASIHEDERGKGDAVDATEMDAIVRDLRSIGANATRAQHPLHPALMERLDAAGIILWMGVGPVDAPGAWTSRGKLVKQAKKRVRTSFHQLQAHPSLVVWNLVNEIAGNGHPKGQIPYIRSMSAELKRRDPGRLVALDIWGKHPPKKAGKVYDNVDAIGDTNYIGWYERTLDSRRSVRAAIVDHIRDLQKVFPDKIMVVTEFGAEANGLNHPDEPGGWQFQADLLELHLEEYAQLPRLSGALVWNLRDFAVAPSFAGGSIRKQVPDIKIVKGINQKGLFTYKGTRKRSADVVKRALSGLPKGDG